jgi:hypothetical protein
MFEDNLLRNGPDDQLDSLAEVVMTAATDRGQ